MVSSTRSRVARSVAFFGGVRGDVDRGQLLEASSIQDDFVLVSVASSSVWPS